ncbi:MAG: hypothetical protein ACRD8O_11515 [Bryobacteraceae bacterium]
MFELFLRLIMVTPFRCRGCRARFYKFGLHHEADASDPERVED